MIVEFRVNGGKRGEHTILRFFKATKTTGWLKLMEKYRILCQQIASVHWN